MPIVQFLKRFLGAKEPWEYALGQKVLLTIPSTTDRRMFEYACELLAEETVIMLVYKTTTISKEHLSLLARVLGSHHWALPESLR